MGDTGKCRNTNRFHKKISTAHLIVRKTNYLYKNLDCESKQKHS